jgi:hypothetical protein
VGARKSVRSRRLLVFVDQSTEAIASLHSPARHGDRHLYWINQADRHLCAAIYTMVRRCWSRRRLRHVARR